MALPGMEGGEAGGAPGGQQPAIGFDRPAQLRNVVAEHFPKAAGLEEIPLHVDDQKRAMLGAEREIVRFGRKVDGLAHGRRRRLLRAHDVAGRPDRAAQNSALDIFGPRLTACRRSRRKEHASRPGRPKPTSRGGDLVLRQRERAANDRASVTGRAQA